MHCDFSIFDANLVGGTEGGEMYRGVTWYLLRHPGVGRLIPSILYIEHDCRK